MPKIIIEKTGTEKSVHKLREAVKSVNQGYAKMLYLSGCSYMDGTLSLIGMVSTGETPIKIIN